MDPLRNFGFLLKDISRLYSHNFERHAAELNMTLAQCKVLSYLQRNEGISQARLAYLSDTDPMTLGRILDRMEGDGLIERRPDPADRRARSLFLQASAIPVLQEIWRHSDRARAKALAGLSAADRAQLMNLLQRVHSNLDALIPNAADTAGAVPRQPRKRAPVHATTLKS
jgi:MarR family transcriptional regulator, transcriptional regulator for hemolysin